MTFIRIYVFSRYETASRTRIRCLRECVRECIYLGMCAKFHLAILINEFLD